MACDILDWRCIFLNELVGSIVLAGILGSIFYFVFAGKLKLGFETTIAFLVPLLLLLGIAIGFISIIMGFVTVFSGIILGLLFNRIIGNR